MDSAELAVQAKKEKNTAALSSVIAAIGLTTFKIIVGVLTGSLGILAEAAHSSFDLIAALVTLVAVRISDRPADVEHNYGHGKVENLSALFETVLLLVTCVWIIYEAVQRLFYKNVEVEVTVWSFLVMGVSIAIDYTRSRVLYRAAKAHHSQALEADALHFSTDIWSSSVVIVGLLGVLAAKAFPVLTFLTKADAIAAMGVALIVVYVSGELGLRTIQGLLDSAPKGMSEIIKARVETLPGITDCHAIRVRYSGPKLFVDAHVTLDGSQSLEQAHRLTEQIEVAISEIAPDADIMIHPEPGRLAEITKPDIEKHEMV